MGRRWLQVDKVTGTCLVFVRTTGSSVTERGVEADITVSLLHGSALENFKSIVTDLYLPVLAEQGAWGKVAKEHVNEFLESAGKFGNMLSETLSIVTGGVELSKPEARITSQFDLKPASIHAAAQTHEIVQHLEECLKSWCNDTERLLKQTNVVQPGEEPGPDTELEYARARMANFNSIMEQLKSDECKMVLSVCQAAKSPVYQRWKALDVEVTDAANEAKDNVKYLAALEPSLEPMYSGSIQDMIAALPSLMNNVKMMYTIARFFGTPENITRLLSKMTNQMITRCKDQVRC